MKALHSFSCCDYKSQQESCQRGKSKLFLVSSMKTRHSRADRHKLALLFCRPLTIHCDVSWSHLYRHRQKIIAVSYPHDQSNSLICPSH